MTPILISNSFPFSLVRRPMRVEPRSVGELLTAMHEHPWVSAWGHDNTVAAASTIACADLRPTTPRPALSLDVENLPSLDGQSFAEIWLLSQLPTRLPPADRTRSHAGTNDRLAGATAIVLLNPHL